MKNIILLTGLAIIVSCASCGSKTAATSDNKTNSAKTENKASTPASSAPAAATGGATAVVRDIYDHAMKKNCAAIPPMLTEDFKKSVGTSKDELDALCDSLTDSGKLTSFEVKGEELKADSGTVKVALNFKDGKKEDKVEHVKKSGDKWLMDS